MRINNCRGRLLVSLLLIVFTGCAGSPEQSTDGYGYGVILYNKNPIRACEIKHHKPVFKSGDLIKDSFVVRDYEPRAGGDGKLRIAMRLAHNFPHQIFARSIDDQGDLDDVFWHIKEFGIKPTTKGKYGFGQMPDRFVVKCARHARLNYQALPTWGKNKYIDPSTLLRIVDICIPYMPGHFEGVDVTFLWYIKVIDDKTFKPKEITYMLNLKIYFKDKQAKEAARNK